MSIKLVCSVRFCVATLINVAEGKVQFMFLFKTVTNILVTYETDNLLTSCSDFQLLKQVSVPWWYLRKCFERMCGEWYSWEFRTPNLCLGVPEFESTAFYILFCLRYYLFYVLPTSVDIYIYVYIYICVYNIYIYIYQQRLVRRVRTYSFLYSVLSEVLLVLCLTNLCWYIYVYIHIYICIYVYIHIYMCIYTYIYIYIYQQRLVRRVRTYSFLYSVLFEVLLVLCLTNLCWYIYMYIYMCVYIYI